MILCTRSMIYVSTALPYNLHYKAKTPIISDQQHFHENLVRFYLNATKTHLVFKDFLLIYFIYILYCVSFYLKTNYIQLHYLKLGLFVQNTIITSATLYTWSFFHENLTTPRKPSEAVQGVNFLNIFLVLPLRHIMYIECTFKMSTLSDVRFRSLFVY